LNRWRLGFKYLYVEQEVGPRARIKKNLLGSALLALDAELVLNGNCKWTDKREFRRKQRNLEMILSLGGAPVKANQKISFERKRIKAPSFSKGKG